MSETEPKMRKCRACGKDVEVGKDCKECGWDEDKEVNLAKRRRLEYDIDNELEEAEKKKKGPEKKRSLLPFARD